jgi:thiamine-phosphate pyrophosphorylase
VAIGGIGLTNAKLVLDAGADSVAIISAIFSAAQPEKIVQDFFRVLR